MKTTPNLSLKKPEGTDIVDIADLNENMDILDAEVAKKVDKVSGKGLSTNDYTTAEKNKLAGIAAGANNYTHPSTHPASIIVQDASNRFVTDGEKSTWNAKAGTAVATTSANGLMSSTDKSKLDGIAAGAQVNTVTSVAGKTGAVTVAKADVGLGNVDNAKQATKVEFDTHLADYIRQPGYGTTGGSANTYTLTLSPALTAYAAGVCVAVKIHAANTGSATLNINGLGAKSIKKANGNDLAGGNLKLNGVYTLRYDGTNFILQGEGGEYGTATASDVLTGKTLGTEDGIINGSMPNNGPSSAETVNLTSQNQEYSIAAGFHSGLRKIKAVISGLAAGVIKAGATVGGVAGTFTSDANAAAGDILSGKTAYVNGNKVTGNIPTRATIIAPKAFNQVWNGSAFDLIATPEPGYYTGSYPSTLIMSDPDFRQENIKEGVDIFGVIGTLAQGNRLASGTGTGRINEPFTITNLAFTPNVVVACVITPNYPTIASVTIIHHEGTGRYGDSTYYGVQVWKGGNEMTDATFLYNKSELFPTSNSFSLKLIETATSFQVAWYAWE